MFGLIVVFFFLSIIALVAYEVTKIEYEELPREDGLIRHAICGDVHAPGNCARSAGWIGECAMCKQTVTLDAYLNCSFADEDYRRHVVTGRRQTGTM